MFDQAVTPAFLPFYLTHRAAFDAWRQESQEPPAQPAMPQAQPLRPSSKSATVAAQLSLFDGAS